ncbi:9280_t:CDS:2 [Entrophospora sp. SA101]|nr:9280_t:CDS:2 [Entrophospora sp. SA101]
MLISHIELKLDIKFIDINHHLANGHCSHDKICEITADYKLHSKLTGTRGGGCALTLIREVTGVTSMINLKELLGSKICPTIESASEIGTSENYTIKTIEITFLDPSLSKIHLLENSLVRYA